MSTKTSAIQPPGRRTPLSLNAGAKPPNNKPAIDNSKKESTANNKTESTKQSSTQPEQKLSTDKKQSSTETRKPSSSSDSKKPDDAKASKNDDNKKNQNGVSTNGVKDKDKQSTNGDTAKLKTDTSSSGSTPKKDNNKSSEKKATTEVGAKETKNESNKNKTTDEKNKEKTNHTDTTKKQDEAKKEKEKEKKEDVKKVVDEKASEEKAALIKSPGKAKSGEKSEKEAVLATVVLDSSSDNNISITPIKEKKMEEMIKPETPMKEKEKKAEETPKKAEQQVEPAAEQLDDVEMMEPLAFEVDPSPQISAISTPAKSYTEIYNRSPKTSPKAEIKSPRVPTTYTPDRKSCPRSFSAISGRRSIRPMGDYTFSGNSHIRESYRKINTELDFTTSSLNVTVGSEVPNNDSFSFFSRSRKRDRTSPIRQSTMEVQGDISPKSPKRARIELGMTGFFSAIASPITMLRARLSRATVQSTPKKQIDIPIEEDIVENVSGISVEEELTATEDLMVNPDSGVGNVVTTDDDPKYDEPSVAACTEKPAADGIKYEDDIKIKETITNTDAQAKKKCSIM